MLTKKIIKDKFFRNKFFKVEKKLLLLRSILFNKNIAYKFKKKFYLRLINISRLYSKSKFKNYCLITGRSRAILRKFKVSRLSFRRLASIGSFDGIRKSSW